MTRLGRVPERHAVLPGDPPGGRRALAMWGVGCAVYFAAVIYRTSLGVAGLDATERFHINASALSAFSILQLLVYAGMQIPVGLLVDRLGPRKVLAMGTVLFTLGQFGFAFAGSYGTALGARALLGCGDAMTFISVLRLGAHWFPARRGPLIAQVAALFGMAGNLVSTLLLARALQSYGWVPAFAGSATAGVLVFGLVVFVLKDSPAKASALKDHPGPPRPRPGMRRQLALTWREPGTRLGFWAHFTTQFPAMVFLLLWGLPFLVEAQGLTRAEAGGFLTLVVLANMVFGLVFGQVIARHHGARTPLVLGTIAATAAVWALTIAWPGGRAPGWELVVLCVVLGACGPASMIGFDYARPANPPERMGTASGVVNVGGFSASIMTLLAVGLLLDATGDDYRIAFGSVFVLQVLGVTQILRLRGRAGRRERERLVASRVETVHVPA
ncbi:MFS transporter [Streptomyces smaragdinus]|nr:MFS transporter [Streptomyces smaragdinus]